MLLRLQNQLKRDPRAYKVEFQQQQQHFQESLAVFKLNPAQQDEARVKDFAELVSFMAHAAPCYRRMTEELPGQMLALLSQHRQTLAPPLRLALAQAVVQLQNRRMIDRMQVLPAFFSLFEIRDAKLRELCYSHIIGDIRRANQKKKDHKVNGALQNYMFKLMRSSDGIAARKALEVMIDLYGRRLWNDAKTVNAICLGCFSNDSKIMCASLRFLLGRNQAADDEEKAEKAQVNLGHLKRETQLVQMGMLRVSRKKKRERELKRLKTKLRKAQRSAQGDEEFDDSDDSDDESGYTHPIELIYDPQAFTERLFTALKRSSHPFNVRLLMMNTISRLIGARELLVFNFYPFLQKYLQPHQRQVTAILSYLAQACHRMVPPDVLQPILQTLAQHFITDRNKTEALVVGLNSVREICMRCPLAMNRELLHDLVEYRKSKEKSVMMAARSIIALYREEHPELLQRRDRGRAATIRLANARAEGDAADSDSDSDAEAEAKELEAAAAYGQAPVFRGAKGAELLEQMEAERQAELLAAQQSAEEGDSGAEDGAGAKKASPRPNKASKRRHAEMEGDEDEDGSSGDDEGDFDDDDLLAGFGLVGDDDEGDEADEDEGDFGDEGDEMVDEGDDDMEDAADEGDLEEMDFDEFMALPSGDEEEDEVEAVPTAESLGISATRILTDDDFRQIEALERQKHQAVGRWGKIKKKREDGSTLLEKGRLREDLVTEDDIKGFVDGRRPGSRPDKEERLAAVLAGREGRGKFGGPKAKGGGTTNQDKLKNKPFLMVSKSHRVRAKQATKFSLRQKARAEHIKNLKRQAKKH